MAETTASRARRLRTGAYRKETRRQFTRDFPPASDVLDEARTFAHVRHAEVTSQQALETCVCAICEMRVRTTVTQLLHPDKFRNYKLRQLLL